MAPETRSRGAPPEGRVYHSSPSLKQVQFPSRRKVVRTYGKRKKREEKAGLKQQTLTQIDFVSSFGEDPVLLSDADSEGTGDDKEDQHAESDGAKGKSEAHEDGRDIDNELYSKSKPPKRWTRLSVEARKRRQTPSDEEEGAPVKKKNITSRRQPMDDPPASSGYHTQTLTQFLGRGSFIANSDSEDDGDGGFLDWLGEPHSPNTRTTAMENYNAKKHSPSSSKSVADASGATKSCPSREESVIPQTPVKSQLTRLEMPSSGGYSIPSTSQVVRYAPPEKQTSPLNGISSLETTPMPKELTGKPKQSARNTTTLVIEDSFATESWHSRTQTPSKSSFRRSQYRESQGEEVLSSFSGTKSGVLSLTVGLPKLLANDAGSKLILPVGNNDQTSCRSQNPQKPKAIIGLREIPDSDDDDDDDDLQSQDVEGEDGFITGIETQLVLEELASLGYDKTSPTCTSSPLASSSLPQVTSNTASDIRQVPRTQKEKSGVYRNQPLASLPSSHINTKLETECRVNPVRRPIRCPASERVPLYSQPFESQRVPLQILQSFPPASARTDILLPIPSKTLDSVLGGYEVHLCLPHKIPKQVVRFWLFDGSLLHYMACVEPGEPRGTTWAYRLDQVYELNNPVGGDDMQEEGWIDGRIRRYSYLPPAVVGQLLWNLRHAIFENENKSSYKSYSEREKPQGDGQNQMDDQVEENTSTVSPTVSQEVAAQIQGDLAHCVQFPLSDPITASSSMKIRCPNTNADLPRGHSACGHPGSQGSNPQPIPSQATTNSQASAPESQSCLSHQAHHDQSYSCGSSLNFQDHGGSAIVLPNSISQLGPSQLLTKSQMLSDSLICDGPRLPLEIWDSDDEVEDIP